MTMGEALGLGKTEKQPHPQFCPLVKHGLLLLPSPAPSLPAQPITSTASSHIVPSKPALLQGERRGAPQAAVGLPGDSGSHLLPIGWKSLLKVEKCFLPAQHLLRSLLT